MLVIYRVLTLERSVLPRSWQ